MRLPLFDLVDQTSALLELNRPSYLYVEKVISDLFRQMLESQSELIVGSTSRIKSEASLKEKMIRNKYYINYDSPQAVLDNLPDLIGLTVECRFITDEDKVYRTLCEHFNITHKGFSQCNEFPELYLNLHMIQPQLQRNGFTIYRIDGYYNFNDHPINFEFQIKSLVHSFWSEVEHQVVYKNTDYVMFDSFMRDILSSIRDNLDVVDHQLEIVYKQILNQNQENLDFGMSERGFKMFMAKSINDLYTAKMIDSIGFTTDFKKCSAILSQYVYIQDFMRYEAPQQRMIEYFEHFNLLRISELDFSEPIQLETPYHSEDVFCDILGKYWESVINYDYEWHVFFVMLFAIQPGNNIQDFSTFVYVIKNLIISRTWFDERFKNLEAIDAQLLKDELVKCIAITLVKVGKIDIVHENKLISVMELFHTFVSDLEGQINHYKDFIEQQEQIITDLQRQINNLF